MKIGRHILASLGFFLGLSGPVSAAFSSYSEAYVGHVSNADFTSLGTSTSAEVIADANNYARARTSAKDIGVEARASGGGSSDARAGWQNVWYATYDDTVYYNNYGPPPPITVPIGAKFSISGVLDPLLVDPNLPKNYAGLGISFEYQLGSNVFSFSGGYDSGSYSRVGATLNTSSGVTDLTSNIVWGTNAAGETTFAFQYYMPDFYKSNCSYLLGCAFTACSDPTCLAESSLNESMRGVIQIFSDNDTMDHHIDLYHSFSVELSSTDPNLTLVSERASTVPVPAAAWLFGSGLLGLIGVARRKKTV